ncbi:hypothetical protein [Aliarcobacter thereius]|uniref:Uncharacterized protein n=1 Tax=Aliarcobacter thereius LMG 24486 TaxID=1032240 RepID=A0A1C7WS21_9BACT|nr:hypothetical protein [Aliarcobacter thereius]OCL91052.1 hypothetical protein AAX25_01220 [Aliarcobacter thereius]OCL96094.1 hypothetical protein AA347_01585 [Aliarcobacter thereius LMG 24486]QBF15934.1 hypothetical protein ATH_0865 [Aliarcobacter thereius LMG 24486]TLS94721.1 hypothetical protein FE244_01160 [Aliarcobacter thereius]TLT07266.1 hypothetical protein FE243_05325 [Aliarcobacter thereius]
MTLEEQNIFIEKIKESILPVAMYMDDQKIFLLLEEVQASNDSLPEGFAKMLFEQIIILKYNRLG